MRIFLCYIFSFFMLAQVAFGIFGATVKRLASSRVEPAPTLRQGLVWEGWGDYKQIAGQLMSAPGQALM